MKKIDIERLLEEAKIIYWKENENGEVIFQQNHIGKLDKNKKLENNVQAPALQLVQEG